MTTLNRANLIAALTKLSMQKTVFVSAPNQEGEAQHTIYCQRCLDSLLAEHPKTSEEYAYRADADCVCANCGE